MLEVDTHLSTSSLYIFISFPSLSFSFLTHFLLGEILIDHNKKKSQDDQKILHLSV